MKRRSRILTAVLGGVGGLTLYLASGGRMLALVLVLVRWSAPTVREIRGGELAELGPRAAVLLDVRTEAEFAVSHIAGARRVEPGSPPPADLFTLPRDTLVVVYCAVGRRSAAMAERLQAAGFSRVRNLRGGIFLWGRDARPLTGPAPVRVHGYNWSWRWLLPDTLRAPS